VGGGAAEGAPLSDLRARAEGKGAKRRGAAGSSPHAVCALHAPARWLRGHGAAPPWRRAAGARGPRNRLAPPPADRFKLCAGAHMRRLAGCDTGGCPARTHARTRQRCRTQPPPALPFRPSRLPSCAARARPRAAQLLTADCAKRRGTRPRVGAHSSRARPQPYTRSDRALHPAHHHPSGPSPGQAPPRDERRARAVPRPRRRARRRSHTRRYRRHPRSLPCVRHSAPRPRVPHVP
jgi:hypothetical protein